MSSSIRSQDLRSVEDLKPSFMDDHLWKIVGTVALTLIGAGLVTYGALSLEGVGVISQLSPESCYELFGAGGASLLLGLGLVYYLVDRAPYEPSLGKAFGSLRKHKYTQSTPYRTPEEVLQEFRETPDAITIRCINRPILISHYGNEGWDDWGFGCVARATKTVLDSQNKNVPFEAVHKAVRSDTPYNFGCSYKAYLLLRRYGLDGSYYAAFPHEDFGTMIDEVLEETSSGDFIPPVLVGRRIGITILGIAKLHNGGAKFLVGDPHQVGKHSLYTITLDAAGKQVSNSYSISIPHILSNPRCTIPSRVAFGKHAWVFVIPKKPNESLS